MKAISYKPAAYWRLDDTAPFQDYSGYNRTGTLSGTEVHGLSLSNNAAYSQRFSNSVSATFPVPVYIAGYESNSFTLTAVIEPVIIGATSSQQILGNLNKMDGLTINGTVVSFSTKYASTGFATASFDIGAYRRCQIFGVHTATKNSLYVDDVLVAEVDITEAQQADTYDSPNSNLYSGASSSSQSFLISNVGVFPSALNSAAITDIYENEARVSPGDVPKKFGGESYDLSTAARIPDLDTGFYTAESLNTGAFTDASLDGTRISANLIADQTLPGRWQNSVNLQLAGANVTFTSLYLDWDGLNVVVEYSANGTAWSTASKRTPIAGLSGIVFIRATFTAGQSEAYIENLRLFGYIANTETINNRVITYPAAAVMYDLKPVSQFNHQWGVDLKGNSITIAADAEMQPTSIELWVKSDDGALTKNFSVSTTKINGVTSSTIPTGEWAHIVYKLSSSPYTGVFTIGGNVTIGQIAVYDYDATAVADKIYATYTGVPVTRAADTGIVAISEPATSVDVYALDWEIVAA